MLVNFLDIHETLILPDTIHNIHDAIKFIDRIFSNSNIKELFEIIFIENFHVHIGSINNEDITILENHKINNDQIKMFYNSFQNTLKEINLDKMVFKLDIGHLINIKR
jgi:ribosomal protein L1